MKMRTRSLSLFIFLLCCVFLFACGGSGAQTKAPAHSPDAPLRDTTPHVLTPEASGNETYTCDSATIDASNKNQGYIMVRYEGVHDKVRLQVKTPEGETYNYILATDGDYETFPLNAGDGTYTICVCENVSDDMYAVVLSQDIQVSLEDDFLPFLYPNQYVWFTENDAIVSEAQTLSGDCYSDFDVVDHVYHYVIDHITYDHEKAANAEYGYLPDVNETLESGTGICFDYAALMSAMLRSQGIPTRLEIGYADVIYHAWISVYIPEIGWIDNMIEFDGNSWSLMDPTFASGGNDVKKNAKDQTVYDAKYFY